MSHTSVLKTHHVMFFLLLYVWLLLLSSVCAEFVTSMVFSHFSTEGACVGSFS